MIINFPAFLFWHPCIFYMYRNLGTNINFYNKPIQIDISRNVLSATKKDKSKGKDIDKFIIVRAFLLLVQHIFVVDVVFTCFDERWCIFYVCPLLKSLNDKKIYKSIICLLKQQIDRRNVSV